VLDALEVIDRSNRVIEFGAFLLGELFFHFAIDSANEHDRDPRPRWRRRQHRKALFRHFGKPPSTMIF